MQQWVMWGVAGGALLLVAGFLFAVFLGLRSPMRPVFIFLNAWSIAIKSIPALPKAIVALATLIGSGAAMQVGFTLYPVFSEDILFYASVVWQALTATGIAALATFLHMFIVHEFLAARRFGSDTVFWRDDALNEKLPPSPPSIGLIVGAAGFGLLFWLLAFGLQAGSNVTVVAATRWVGAHTSAAEARLAGAAVFAASLFVSFFLKMLFTLVRPALSLRAGNPLLQGVGLAFRRLPALLVLSAILLVAPAVLGPLSIVVPQMVFPGNQAAAGVGAALFIGFSVFQIVAVEAATVLFTNRAMNLSSTAHSDPAQGNSN